MESNIRKEKITKEKITCQFDGTNVKVKIVSPLSNEYNKLSPGFYEVLRNCVLDYNKHYKKAPCVQISNKKNDPFLRAIIVYLLEYEICPPVNDTIVFRRTYQNTDTFYRYIERIPKEMRKYIGKITFRNHFKYYYPSLYDIWEIAKDKFYYKDFNHNIYKNKENLFRKKVNMALEEFKMLASSTRDEALFSKICPKIAFHNNIIGTLLKDGADDDIIGALLKDGADDEDVIKISFNFSEKGGFPLRPSGKFSFSSGEMMHTEYIIDLTAFKKDKLNLDKFVEQVESKIVLNNILGEAHPNSTCCTRSLAEFFSLILLMKKNKDLAKSRVTLFGVYENYFYDFSESISPINDDSDKETEDKSE